jgi:phospholipid/cholesterol/gamma-HCH transport system permease protein
MGVGWLEAEERPDRLDLRAGGRWDVGGAARLDAELARALKHRQGAVAFDLTQLERLDTAGAWLLLRAARGLESAGVPVEFAGLRPEHQAMLEQVAENDRPGPVAPPRSGALGDVVARIGRATLRARRKSKGEVRFLGHVVSALAQTAVQPRRLRLTALVAHMEEVGFNALPIVGLISLLIGVVLAYQGAEQLQKFGAQVFVVNLVGVSVLREVGILLTAIVVAGRSGSAFAASIGSMVIREEVDAMHTLGLSPVEVLVLPRILALVLMMPALAFFADLMGLLGGGLMCWLALDVTPMVFLDRLRAAVGASHFWVGMAKAPVFGFVIGLVGCLDGLRVSGSAESVGRQTTRAVVTSIFLVIVADAFFSIFFSYIGV